MDQRSKAKAPALSLIVPRSQQLSARADQRNALRASLDAIAAPMQKRLFPVACRVVPTDQWFTSRVDRTWKVIDLKLWLLSKTLPSQILPLPASFRPSSPVTFASAPPPVPRPSTSASYHPPVTPHTPPAKHISSSAPSSPAFSPTTSSQRGSPAAPLSPTPSTPPPSAQHFSVDADDEDDVSLYAHPYGLDTDDRHPYHHDEYDARITPRSIPYSFSTGAPAISGLDVLRANANKVTTARSYGATGIILSGDTDLVKKAEAISKKWCLYSFSTGTLLSDDLPLSEYSIRPYELLEMHRSGAYVRLPRADISGPYPYPDDTEDEAGPLILPESTARAYPSTTTTTHVYPATSTRHPVQVTQTTIHTRMQMLAPDYSDDSDSDQGHASSYAQPYFDAYVSVLLGSAATGGSAEATENDGVDPYADSANMPTRKMRRRARAKSEAHKAGKGKERANREREWADLQGLIGSGVGLTQDAEVRLNGHAKERERWQERWLVLREGSLTVWRDRMDEMPEASFEVATCVGLYGADKIPSIVASAPTSHMASMDSSTSHPSTSSSATLVASGMRNVICARFRASSPRKAGQRAGTWLVMRLPDESTHEHLLRILHRIAYCSPVPDSRRPSTSSTARTATPYTRTLRTEFLPNPIPHPLSLSFSPPSPVTQGELSPSSPIDGSSDSGEHEHDLDPDWADDISWTRSCRSKGKAKIAAPMTMGLGRGMGVRYPEWRELVLKKAIKAGQGAQVQDGWRDSEPDSALDSETPREDSDDMYGFGGRTERELDAYAAYLARDEYDSDDPDSDTLSETEWDGWAYDLDRPKVVDEVDTGNALKKRKGGLKTPQGSPVSGEESLSESFVAIDSRGVSTLPRTLRRRRAQSFTPESPVVIQPQTDTSTSPGSPPSATTPTTPGSRMRASTVSSHSSHSTITSLSQATLSTGTRVFYPEQTSVRRTETVPTGGVRGLMRGLSMRAGRESFMRGLENALDFVEGK